MNHFENPKKPNPFNSLFRFVYLSYINNNRSFGSYLLSENVSFERILTNVRSFFCAERKLNVKYDVPYVFTLSNTSAHTCPSDE